MDESPTNENPKDENPKDESPKDENATNEIVEVQIEDTKAVVGGARQSLIYERRERQFGG